MNPLNIVDLIKYKEHYDWDTIPTIIVLKSCTR